MAAARARAVQSGLGEEPGAQAMPGGKIHRQPSKDQSVPQDCAQRIRCEAVGQGAIGE